MTVALFPRCQTVGRQLCPGGKTVSTWEQFGGTASFPKWGAVRHQGATLGSSFTPTPFPPARSPVTVIASRCLQPPLSVPFSPQNCRPDLLSITSPAPHLNSFIHTLPACGNSLIQPVTIFKNLKVSGESRSDETQHDGCPVRSGGPLGSIVRHPASRVTRTTSSSVF